MSKSIQLSPETIADVRDAVFALAEKTLPANFYLVAADFEKESGHWFLRLYIDNANQQAKISLQDCETASRAIDEHLETIKHLRDFPYTLEVSSPGAFRPLTTQREFDFYKGRAIKIERPNKSNSKRMEVITGTLTSAQNGTLQLDGESITLNEHTHVYLNPDIRLPEEGEDDSADINLSTTP